LKAIRYKASPEFLTLIRVCDSGGENFDMLVGETDFAFVLQKAQGTRTRSRERATHKLEGRNGDAGAAQRDLDSAPPSHSEDEEGEHAA
jgi:hypothetical protein